MASMVQDSAKEEAFRIARKMIYLKQQMDGLMPFDVIRDTTVNIEGEKYKMNSKGEFTLIKERNK